MAVEAVKKWGKEALETFNYFLWKEFWTMDTLTTKNCEKENLPAEEKQRAMESRFTGYQTLCLFGLGSMFWGTVTGVLAHFEKEKKPEWIHYCFIYSAVALVSMLIGFAASTFPRSSFLAPSMAGSGALHAFVFVLGTFHISYLKYHAYVTECFYSLASSTVAVIFYWAFSCQDPLILHILAKLVFWIIGVFVYGVCFVFYKILDAIWWFLSKLVWVIVWTRQDSIKNRVVLLYYSIRGYQPAPQNLHP